MQDISILGTHSDAGKSTVTMLISKMLQRNGINLSVFKAQNVSNNASVATDGSEIAVAQYFQTQALGVNSSWHNNPILLKSGRKSTASLIVEGKAISTPDVREYYRDLDRLKPIVKRAFEGLKSRYDLVVSEGAGSPVELNLMDKDLSNIFIAREFKTSIILVADIEKGGVFASIYGTLELLPKDIKKQVAGVVINKFRGDRSLFDRGVEIIEKDFKTPVLGVLPYKALNLGFEDSQSLINYSQEFDEDALRVAVISYPKMSNYNDFEPLLASREYRVDFVSNNRDLSSYDLVILPGSKLVIEDLRWLKRVGLFDRIKEFDGEILGICGGFEMMFRAINDPLGLEGVAKDRELGFGWVDDEIELVKEKVVKRGSYNIFGKEIKSGFEIHNGISSKYPIYFDGGKIKGTFVHSLFDTDEFLEFKSQKIEEYVDSMSKYLNLSKAKNLV